MGEALDDDGIVHVDIKEIDENIPKPEPPTPAEPVNEVSESVATDQEDSEQEITGTPISSVQSSPVRSQSAVASSRGGYPRPPRPITIGEHHPTSTPSPPPPQYLAPPRSPAYLTSPAPPASPTPPPSQTPNPATPARNANHNQQYVAILDKVITAARRSTLPSYGSFDMSQIYANLPIVEDAVDMGLRSLSQIERDCKIGAAGELYVRVRLYPHRSFTDHRPRLRYSNCYLACSLLDQYPYFLGTTGRVTSAITSPYTQNTPIWSHGRGGKPRTSHTWTLTASLLTSSLTRVTYPGMCGRGKIHYISSR